MLEAEALGESLGDATRVEGAESASLLRLVEAPWGRAVVLILKGWLVGWWERVAGESSSMPEVVSLLGNWFRASLGVPGRVKEWLGDRRAGRSLAVEVDCRGGAVTRDGTSSGAECTEERKEEEEEQRYEALEEKDRLAAWEEWRRAIFGRSVPFIF